LVSDALNALGTIHLKDHVISLRTGMMFDIPGMPLGTKINENLKRLNFELAVKIRLVQRLHPGHWEHAGKRIQYEFTFEDSYYTQELHFLIRLLSQHRALIETRDFVESGDLPS